MEKVYLIGSQEEGKYKIGHTHRNISKRLDEIQVGNPHKLEVIDVFETEHHIKVESWMHKVYSSKRMEGEWFKLSKEDIDNFRNNCKMGHDNIQVLIDYQNPFIK